MCDEKTWNLFVCQNARAASDGGEEILIVTIALWANVEIELLKSFILRLLIFKNFTVAQKKDFSIENYVCKASLDVCRR